MCCPGKQGGRILFLVRKERNLDCLSLYLASVSVCSIRNAQWIFVELKRSTLLMWLLPSYSDAAADPILLHMFEISNVLLLSPLSSHDLDWDPLTRVPSTSFFSLSQFTTFVSTSALCTSTFLCLSLLFLVSWRKRCPFSFGKAHYTVYQLFPSRELWSVIMRSSSGQLA